MKCAVEMTLQIVYYYYDESGMMPEEIIWKKLDYVTKEKLYYSKRNCTVSELK